MATYVCVIEVRLRIRESHDLKGKRKVLHSLKAQLRNRFGAAVAETEGHDTWQGSTLVCALVGDGAIEARADDLQRFVEARIPEGVRFDRTVTTVADLRG